jgi:hypothetical protein
MVNSLMHLVSSLFNLVEQHSCSGWAEGGTSSELISSSSGCRCIYEGWSKSGDSSCSVGSVFVKLGFGSWSCLLYNSQVNKWQHIWFWRCYLVISMVRIRAIPLSDRAVQGSSVVSVASAGVAWISLGVCIGGSAYISSGWWVGKGEGSGNSVGGSKFISGGTSSLSWKIINSDDGGHNNVIYFRILMFKSKLQIYIKILKPLNPTIIYQAETSTSSSLKSEMKTQKHSHIS